MKYNPDKLPEEKFIGLLKENEALKKTINDYKVREINYLREINLLKAIPDNISTGVAIIDGTGQFLLFNKEFLRLFGLSVNSTIVNVNDQKWSEWKVYDENMNPLDVDNYPVRKAVRTGRKITNQIAGIKLPGGGEMIWVLISAEPVNKGNVDEMIICTYQDITKSKRAEENLVINEDRLRLTLESAELGSWDFDIDTGIAVHSLRHDQIFGYHELQPEWSYEISIKHMFPEYHQIVRDAVATAIKTGELYYEAEIAWPDGSRHWIAPKGRVLYNKQGKPVRMIGVVSDITERKEAEKILIENENRLRELNQTKDKFFSIIAHDLKSPFTSILGFSELLTEKINRKDYSDLDEYAKMIHRSSRRAMELLTNLFEWSKLQTGSIEFNPVELDIVSVVNEVLDLLGYAAWHKSIQMTTELPEEFIIKADKYMISSVLRNLISNALKFTFPEGRINISAEPDGNYLKVTVSDNGAGISKDDLDKLFRMDLSYSAVGTKGEEGTGLGLLLCKEFISRHGGRIWAESEVGKGSIFSFTIPE